MPITKQSTRNKHQIRTEDTKVKLLDAAQALFSEYGFESTQLEQVAARAGFTRGAIYAHYPSKEDLFLDLLDKRLYANFKSMYAELEIEPSRKKRLAIFRSWLLTQVLDPSWGTLMLEFKLYAMRRPGSQEKFHHLTEVTFQSSSLRFVDLLFGPGLSRPARRSFEGRIVALGAALNAVVLENRFNPERLPANQLKTLTEEFINLLMRA